MTPSESLEVRFVIGGSPVPQGSWVAFVSRTTRKAMAKPSNEKSLKRWRAVVAETAKRAMADRPPLTGPLQIMMLWALPCPAAARNRPYPDGKPDADKLERALWDGLTSIVMDDDSRFVDHQSRKRYAGRPGSLPFPGVRVIVSPMPIEPLAT